MAEDRLKTLEERTRYEPADVEGRVFERWDRAGIFHPEPEGTPDENYSIAVPPPNVTGNLHMGHALHASIQDLQIHFARWPRMRAPRIFRSWIDALSASPMCTLPVTLGGGSAIA